MKGKKEPPETPRAFQMMLSDRAKNESKRTGIPAKQLIESYYHRRLLARVFHADDPNWVLKGGQALLVRWAEVRHSTDIDLLSRSEKTVDDAVAALIEAVSVELGDKYDPLTFMHASTKKTHDIAETRAATFNVMFGNKKLHTVKVDVVAASEPRGKITAAPLKPPIDMDCKTWPDAYIYPIEDHIADKICAIYTDFGPERGFSSRYKDLVDLLLIAIKATPLQTITDQEVHGARTHRAVHAEAKKRITKGVNVVLPVEFTVPDLQSWTGGYGEIATKVPGFPSELHTLNKAQSLAHSFISPLLVSTPPPGSWQPDQRAWV